MSSIAEAIALAAPSFTGQLLRPTDHAYDYRRHVHNGLIDKRPAAIASCQGVADIVDAVRLARTLGLEVSVRGGGHNVAGRATIDQGLMIDLSPMKGVHVDVSSRTARAQGGVLWREFNRETQLHGLATTGGVVGSTGIAGLTLGGGVGWLMPKYGLALDNLRAADMVIADGRVVRASADENPDLFWAIRGGGGNFGIAASLEYGLHQVGPMVTGGVVAHPLARAFDVLRFFRDTCRVIARRGDARRGSADRAGWLERQVGRHSRRPLRSARAGRGGFSVSQGVWSTGDGPDGPAAVRGTEQDDRSRVSEGRAQLLESAVPGRLERRGDSHAHRRLSGMPVADEPPHHRALPRRGEPRSGDRNGVPDAHHRLQRRHRLAVDGVGGDRPLHHVGSRYLLVTHAISCADALRQLPRRRCSQSRRGRLRTEPSRLRGIKTKYDPENFFRHNVNILPK